MLLNSLSRASAFQKNATIKTSKLAFLLYKNLKFRKELTDDVLHDHCPTENESHKFADTRVDVSVG